MRQLCGVHIIIPKEGRMPTSVLSAKEVITDLLIRYGFQLLGAVVVLVAGALLARWVGNTTGKWLETRRMEPPVRTLIVRVVRVVVMVFTLVVALDKFGFQIAPLVAGIGVAGLGIGIALQGVLSNVVAGLSIIFTKPFRVGEYIALLGVQGEVSLIELFSTTLVHPDRSRVVIPNRKVVGEILHNYGVVRQLALSVQVGYGSDLGQVLETAREVVAGNARVLRDLPPVIGVGGLGDGSVTVNVGPWVAATDYVPAQAELYRALVEALRSRQIGLGGLTEVRLVPGA
jgi:small conductance mechanosensitive channel